MYSNEEKNNNIKSDNKNNSLDDFKDDDNFDIIR